MWMWVILGIKCHLSLPQAHKLWRSANNIAGIKAVPRGYPWNYWSNGILLPPHCTHKPLMNVIKLLYCSPLQDYGSTMHRIRSCTFYAIHISSRDGYWHDSWYSWDDMQKLLLQLTYTAKMKGAPGARATAGDVLNLEKMTSWRCCCCSWKWTAGNWEGTTAGLILDLAMNEKGVPWYSNDALKIKYVVLVKLPCN